jgi:hypothetical protein
MQRSGKKALFVTLVLYCAIGVSAALLRHIFHGHGCAEIKNGVSDMRSLAISIVSYEYQFGGALPQSLAVLGLPPAGEKASGQHAGYVDSQLASGVDEGYVFHYRLTRSSRSKTADGFVLTAEPIGPPAGRHFYFIDETGEVRSENDHPASASSPHTTDTSCVCWEW